MSELPPTPPPTTEPAQPTAQIPQPPKKSHTLRTVLLITIPIAALLFIGGLFVVGSIIVTTFGPVSNTFSNDGNIDKQAIEKSIAGASDTVTSVEVGVGIDGFSHNLYVYPTISTSTVTVQQLDAMLEAAYLGSKGKAENITFGFNDAAGKDIDITMTIEDLGILWTDVSRVNSTVTYSAKSLGYRYDS